MELALILLLIIVLILLLIMELLLTITVQFRGIQDHGDHLVGMRPTQMITNLVIAFFFSLFNFRFLLQSTLFGRILLFPIFPLTTQFFLRKGDVNNPIIIPVLRHPYYFISTEKILYRWVNLEAFRSRFHFYLSTAISSVITCLYYAEAANNIIMRV